MSIFDQIGKRISDAGQETATKARNFAEITKLNGVITDNEKKIGKLYMEIGKSYCQKHKMDEEAEEKELINEIIKLEEEINQNKEQIKKIKGVERCPQCGAEVVMGSAFCNSCGARIAEERNEAGKRCPQCGGMIDGEDIFCNSCGKKLK